MLAVKGFYENGRVVIPSPPPLQRRMAVVVTFLEEIEENATTSATPRYSFARSRELLKDCAASLADAVVEERRNAV